MPEVKDQSTSYTYKGEQYDSGSGPIPYAPPGIIPPGTYPEPPEGYNQYQVEEDGKITSYDIGTGIYPNVGPGLVPTDYTVIYSWKGIYGRSYTTQPYAIGDKIPITVTINTR